VLQCTLPDGAPSNLPPGMSFDSTTGTISGTPQNLGSYIIKITPYVNGQAQSSQNLSLVAAQKFAQWANSNNVSPSTTQSLFPDQVPDLLKYLYDIDPNSPIGLFDIIEMPTPSFDTTITPGTTYLTLTYRQYALATGVTVTVQTSSDLQNWTTVNPPAVFRQIGADDSTPNYDPIMQIGVVASGARQFIRLQVTSP
jgi:hypothetical protein